MCWPLKSHKQVNSCENCVWHWLVSSTGPDQPCCATWLPKICWAARLKIQRTEPWETSIETIFPSTKAKSRRPILSCSGELNKFCNNGFKITIFAWGVNYFITVMSMMKPWYRSDWEGIETVFSQFTFQPASWKIGSTSFCCQKTPSAVAATQRPSSMHCP